MKKLCIFVSVAVYFLITGFLQAQEEPPAKRHKNIFVELGGNSIGPTLNFDMRLKRGVQHGWGVHGGAGASLEIFEAAPKVKSGPGILSFPVGINYLFGKRRSAFEAGLGLTPVRVNYVKISVVGDNFLYGPRWATFAFLNMGYRFQPLRRGIMFRVNLALARWPGGFYSSAGVSLGYGFK